MLKTIRLIFTFYKGFLLASIIITSCCGLIFWEYGLSVFRALFWLKISTLAISFYFINTYKAREYYYAQAHYIVDADQLSLDTFAPILNKHV